MDPNNASEVSFKLINSLKKMNYVIFTGTSHSSHDNIKAVKWSNIFYRYYLCKKHLSWKLRIALK